MKVLVVVVEVMLMVRDVSRSDDNGVMMSVLYQRW